MWKHLLSLYLYHKCYWFIGQNKPRDPNHIYCGRGLTQLMNTGRRVIIAICQKIYNTSKRRKKFFIVSYIPECQLFLYLDIRYKYSTKAVFRSLPKWRYSIRWRGSIFHSIFLSVPTKWSQLRQIFHLHIQSSETSF